MNCSHKVPEDLRNNPTCKKYTYRTPGGALVFQATRDDNGEWVDTTDEQYAKEHDGKKRSSRAWRVGQREPGVSGLKPKEDELAKAEALLRLLEGGGN